MILKVLIAEDHESANISVRKTLEELGITQVDHVYYCDDALQKINNSKAKNQPYDLLITDLFFEEDQQVQQITGGAELINAARQAQPELKVLVFSAESKAAVIEMLFSQQQIDGYVRKARHDSQELKSALTNLSNNQRYYPRHLAKLVNQMNSHQFTEYDIRIITLLADGTHIYKIPSILEQDKIRPSGLSSVEKRLKLIREVLGFLKNEQLVAFCKDRGII